MGARDLAASPTTAEVEAFRVAGAYLARRGLVHGTEGNLSMFDGDRLLVTRTGCTLGDLGPDDVFAGSVDAPPDDASSDLQLHLEFYRRPGVAAVAHAHPPDSVPGGWKEGEPHGAYALGHTLEHALATMEHALNPGSNEGAADPIQHADPFAAVSYGWEVKGSDESGGPTILMLDQTRLPFERRRLVCRTVGDVADAIRRLMVRGAPILGITAALGVALAAELASDRGDDPAEAASEAADLLIRTRPTAVNISWAVQRVMDAASDASDRYAVALLAESLAIQREDARACSGMGWLGAELIPDGANVITHCNTGMLCTAGVGTAMGVIWCAHLAGKGIHVWVDETRPALQGARLTAWELQRLGVPFTLVADALAGSLMASGRVDLVVVGADRIAANGDVANKIGTYPLAVLAREHGVPFYVVAPTSTVDPATRSGDRITIEERDPREVTSPRGVAIAPEGTPAYNPAFDVTPARLVTAIVTERGVARPPYEGSLRALSEYAPEVHA